MLSNYFSHYLGLCPNNRRTEHSDIDCLLRIPKGYEAHMDLKKITLFDGAKPVQDTDLSCLCALNKTNRAGYLGGKYR